MFNPTFATDYFWQVEGLFRKFKGVTLSQVGYARGGFENPTYEDMCTDKTGRAEAAEVEYGHHMFHMKNF